jgi:hypothetical protein
VSEAEKIRVCRAYTISWSVPGGVMYASQGVSFDDAGDMTPVDLFNETVKRAKADHGAPEHGTAVLFYQMLETRPLRELLG